MPAADRPASGRGRDADDREADDPGGHVHLVYPDGRRRQQPSVVELSALREEPHRPWLNIPNAITFLRALLVPVILVLLMVETRAAQWWAFGIFLFAAATDTVDGWVARRWHGVTRWGQFADPIADKLLVIGTLAALAWLAALPWWAVIVIAVREIAVTVLRLRMIDKIDVVMPASAWGKSKTVSQLVAVAVWLLPGIALSWRLGLLYLAVVLTVASGVQYAFRAGSLYRRARAASDDAGDGDRRSGPGSGEDDDGGDLDRPRHERSDGEGDPGGAPAEPDAEDAQA